MRIPTQEEFAAHLQAPYFRQLTATIDALGLEGYIVGGYVRDYILKRPSKDVDVVVVVVAEAVVVAALSSFFEHADNASTRLIAPIVMAEVAIDLFNIEFF